jgi:hypothetical protein
MQLSASVSFVSFVGFCGGGLIGSPFSSSEQKVTANQHALASGQKVTLSNGAGDRVTIELIADFPDFIPDPHPALPANVRLSNPFHLVVLDDQAYVTDGGQNHLWQVDIPSGTVSVLAAFPSIANPFFNPAPPPPGLGGPVIEAVPTGIRHLNGQLLVTLFSGVPFAPGSSQVQTIDLLTGDQAPLITGLKTAIDVIPVQDGDGVGYLVLEHASTGFFFGSPGSLLGFGTPSDPLEKLCRIYWPPLYAYIRRDGHDATEAQDLTQEFFARLLTRDYLQHLHHQQGKFRSFLLACLKNFLSEQRRKAGAQKRGGGLKRNSGIFASCWAEHADDSNKSP